MAELKPCPFCGSIPFVCVNKYRHDQFTYLVKCSNSACNIIPFTYECSEETQAISDWNKRADAVEVKHGEWINEGDYLYKCSLCGDKAFLRLGGKPCRYCPSCGAKMDGATDTNVGGKLKEGAEE